MTWFDFIESKQLKLAPPRTNHEEERERGPLEALRLRAARWRKATGRDKLVVSYGPRVPSWAQMRAEHAARELANKSA